MKKQKRWRSWFMILIIVVLVVVLSLFIPWSAFGLSSHPHPAQSYDEAAQRVAALRADRTSDMNPDCLTQFMTHGQKSPTRDRDGSWIHQLSGAVPATGSAFL